MAASISARPPPRGAADVIAAVGCDSVRPLPPEGRWIGEAAHGTWDELRLYLRTFAALLRGPRHFGQAWGDGQLKAINPLAFAGRTLAALTVVGLVYAALPGAATHDDGGSSLLRELLKAGGSYLHLAALGALSHLVLKVMRRRRMWLGSVGLALYAGGLATLTAAVLETALACALPGVRALSHVDLGGGTRKLYFALVMAPLILSFGLFVWLFGSALAGLHRVARAATVTAVLLAFIGTGIFFGYVDPPGDYGLRLELRLKHEGQHWKVRAALGLS